MANGFYDMTIKVADYPQVKAVIEAADAVCEAEGSQPWSLTEAIEALRQALDNLKAV